MSEKTLNNHSLQDVIDNVSDIEVFGDGGTWRLICKASSKSEGWMKSTKAMEIPGYGCLVQTSTQQWDKVAEALTFVPGTYIKDEYGYNEKNERTLIARYLRIGNGNDTSSKKMSDEE